MPESSTRSKRRPNILFILSDDQGVWAAGCYGNHEIHTPNLDRLAASGVRMENFFVATPVCSPSRATLLTGRIPSQHGVHDWIRGGNVDPGAIRFLEGQTALTDVLSGHGWRCGISGKWHLGDSQHPQHGFSWWFVHQLGGGPYMNPPMVVDGRLENLPGYVTHLITDNALAFLDTYGRDSEPFYLSVHYTAPHSPWDRAQHPAEFFDLYADCPFETCPQEPRHPWAISLTDRCLNNREMLQGYFAAVTAMDRDIGRLLDKLDELGIRNDTLVVFVSDNGFSCGHHGFWGKGNGTYPLNMYENSIRVPALFSHPGVLPEGVTRSAMVSAYDMTPTLLDYLGLPVPNPDELPGCSFLPVLEGSAQEARDDVVVFDEYGGVRMIRTPEWKFVHRHPDGPHELFHVAEDPGERRNLADDPGCREIRNELHERMETWFDRYVVPELDGRRFPVDGRGQTRRPGSRPQAGE